MRDKVTNDDNNIDELVSINPTNGVKVMWKCVNPSEMSVKQTFHFNRKRNKYLNLKKRYSLDSDNETLFNELDKCKRNLIEWTLESCPIRVREEGDTLKVGEIRLQKITENELKLNVDDVKDTFKLVEEEEGM